MKTRVVAASLLMFAATSQARAVDPKVRVRLAEDNLFSGEVAKVKVKTASNGYLVVLRLDTEGRVRVLFPVDPTDNASVKGGKEWEIRSRGDRDSFVASEKTGAGIILAARSDAPFNFADFTASQRWNTTAFVSDKPNPDGEAMLLSLVDRMGGGHYDYDVVTYHVTTALPRTYYADRYRARYSAYDSWYDARYGYGAFSPWPYYGPTYGPSLGFGFGFGYIPLGYPGRIGRRR